MSDPPTESNSWQPAQPPSGATGAGAYAVPVQPLQYVLPDYRGRPGLITAIGVISIIVASVGMLAALFTVLQAGGYYMMSIMSTSMAGARARSSVTVSSFPPPVPVQVAGAAVPGVGPRGMGDAERRATVRVLTDLRPMTPRRKSQLDAILAQAGKDLATDHVTDSGTMPEARSGEAPPDYFVTPAGRLEVFNDRAVFFPSNNSPTVRVSAPPAAAVQGDPGASNASVVSGAAGAPGGQGPVAAVQVPATGPTTAASPMPGALTPAEVQAVVQSAQSVASTPLNPAQVAGLQTVLAAPGQQLVPPGGSQGAVLAVYPSSGSAVIQFSTGSSLTLAPTGTVSAMMTAPVMPTILINPAYLTAMAVTALVSLGLAVYLLICGIMALRQSPRARRWHLIYASIKLPLAVAGAVASALVARDMMASIGAAGPGASTWGFSLFSGAVPLVLGCAYPVALLIALNLKQVKDYYALGAGQRPAAA
jgi:hypothetical protein